MKSTKFLILTGCSIVLGLCGIAVQKTNAAADPNATTAVQNEINYITSLHDQGMTLSMQTVGNPWLVNDMTAYSSGESEITRVNQITGQFPAICDDDFLNCNDYASSHGASVISLAENYAAAGGLVAFEWHEGNPNSSDPDALSFYVGGSGEPSPLSSTDWNNLLNVPSSTLHQNWLNHMNLLAGWLGQLQSAGVTVIWRPYHEGDGSWFWWGGNAADYVALYQMEFNYLTGTKGIHNCIWVTSSPSSSAFYPGPNYVDFGGMDIYSSSQTDPTYQNTANTLQSFQNAGSIALTETGLLPSTSIIHQVGYAWVNIWCGSYLDGTYYGASGTDNTNAEVQNFYNDGNTVNRGRVAVPTAPVTTGVWYNIVNQNSGKILAVSGASTSDGANIQQYDNNGTPDHNWEFLANGNGSFRIMNQNSSKVVGISGMGQGMGNQAVQWDDNGSVDHNWDLVSQGNGYYHIVDQNSGLLLGVSGMSTADSANVVQWSDNGSADHNWQFVPINSPLSSGHGFHIINAHSGLFIDNPGGTNVPGTFLQQFQNTYSTAQQWTATNISGDLWTFVNQGGGLAIDDFGWSTSAGQQMDEWTYGGAAVQQFHIDPVGDGTYTVVSDVSNLNIEIGGASIANGGILDQWYSNGNPCQHWIFQQVN